MKDMQAHLEKLHRDAAECAIIRDLATDPKKRELFAKLAEHMSVLASEVERAIAKDTDKAASVCRLQVTRRQIP
jgi:heme oxygenase